MAGRIIISTYPDNKTAEIAAREIINEKRDAACVNIIKTRSYYIWKNEFVDSEECLVIFKTTEEKSKDLIKDIELNHPYEVPEIVEIKPEKMNEKYLKWITEVTKY